MNLRQRFVENESQLAIHTSVPFRVRVGVTGHRELPDPQALSSKIKEAIERIIPELFDNESKNLLRSSTHTPIAHTVVTPLAEGADRLLAREVLKHPLADIEVVLPLHKEDYLEDFDSSESRQEFEELFAKARRPITLQDQPLNKELSQSALAEARREAYKAVGRYVVDHCDVLIALWDGEPARGKGGTAEIVGYAKSKSSGDSGVPGSGVVPV